MSYKCEFCGRYFESGGNRATFRWDIIDNQYRYQTYYFCCDGHYQQYKNITDKTECCENGKTFRENQEINEKAKRDRRERELIKTSDKCPQCGNYFRKGTGYGQGLRNQNNKTYRTYYFCDRYCCGTFKDKNHLTAVGNDGLTPEERNQKKVDKENKKILEKELIEKYYKALNEYALRKYSSLFESHFGKKPSKERCDAFQVKIEDTVMKRYLADTEIGKRYSNTETAIRNCFVIEQIKLNEINTWGQLMEFETESEKEKEKPIEGTKVNSKEPEIIKEIKKSWKDLKDGFKKSWKEVKDEFNKEFKK